MSMVSRPELDDAKRLVGVGAPLEHLHSYMTRHLMIVGGYSAHPQKAAIQKMVAKEVTRYLQFDEQGEVVPRPPKPLNATLVTWKGVKVVTTEKLAKLFRIEEITLRTLFTQNRRWFREELDYFQLTEADLKKLWSGGSRVGRELKGIMLWTDTGAGQMSRLIQHKVLTVESEPKSSPEPVDEVAAVICEPPVVESDLPILEWQSVRVVTTATLAKGYNTKDTNIRTNLDANRSRFIEGIHIYTLTGCELKNFKNRVSSTDSVGKNARSLTLWTEKGAARMSKIVDTDQAWAFFEKLEDAYFRIAPVAVVPAAPTVPQSLPEALRLAADLAEQKQQLTHQLEIAAPKVEFANLVDQAEGILIGNFAKLLGLGQNFLFTWLRDNEILNATGERRNTPRQQYLERGYFAVGEKPIITPQGVKLSFTPRITGKGQQWLTKRLLDAGVVKPISII